MIEVISKQTNNGIKLKALNRTYLLKYTNSIWNSFPSEMKDFLQDNLVFISAGHVPIFVNENKIFFNTSEPLIKPWFYEMLTTHIPFCADVDKRPTTDFIKEFLNIEFRFKNYDTKFLSYNSDLEEKAVISFSFGKESLLTFGILNEIGIDCTLVYFEEPNSPIEIKSKRLYAKNFKKFFNRNVVLPFNGFQGLSEYKNFGVKKTEWGFGNGLTQYCLELLPIMHETRSKFMLLGNEQSCDYWYMSGDGFKSYPVSDQTSQWTRELDKFIRLTTNNKSGVFSVVEPINELSVIKILFNRYKQLGKYQLSCFPDNVVNIDKDVWCHKCTKCARIFLFLRANGIDVRDVGFHENLFDKKYMNNFSLFNGKTETSTPYDYSGAGRDEQLFAFYLAYRKGQTGDLMEIFANRFLEEAKMREDELHKKFFGVFDSTTIPKELEPKIMSIFKEELGSVSI